MTGPQRQPRPLLWLTGALLLSACGETATLAVSDGSGTAPVLPQPVHTVLPTVNIAPAVGWASGATPVAASGTQVAAFAAELDHPRWLYVLPNRDVLVAETNAPPKPDDSKGIKGWLMGLVMQRAGAATPSADRITLLRDTNGDGVADFRSVLLSGLHSPLGMTLIDKQLFVANSDAIWRFTYETGDTTIRAVGTRLVELPAGPISHHWTKNLIASKDGRTLYVAVGSNSNVAERGMEVEAGRAAIWQVDTQTGANRVFASGLRNPVGMAWEPASGVLWAVVNERDELGSDLVPDYLTSVVADGFYGCPYSYYGLHVDVRMSPSRPDLVAKARVPDYALGPHTASLGLVNAQGSHLPGFQNGMFIGQHGSWNRQPHSGYKVVFVPFAGGKPMDVQPLEVLGGFLSPEGRAWGRPVGLAIDTQGALLVADDVGNAVWRVSAL